MRSLVPKFKCLTCARAKDGKNNRNNDQKRAKEMLLAAGLDREGWRQDGAVNLVVILFVISPISAAMARFTFYCNCRAWLVGGE